MRIRIGTIAAGMLSVATLAFASGDVYRVTVSRLDSNLYRDLDSKAIIQTALCLELAIADDAVLKWEGKYGDNWIVFSSGEKCDVRGVY